MKFSVLLPTRNRLDLLILAIESVRMQDYDDWEIIVSDNASDGDIREHLSKLGEARIHVRRFDRLVPVTDNWNAALESGSGDYFIMLGDDDVLVPGGLSRMRSLIDSWNAPEAVYAQAHQYAYPNVVPGHAAPFVQTGYNAFLDSAKEAFQLDSTTARKMVDAAMDFRILYGFNMQHFVFSRRLVERLKSKGPFFQSPYPDYYAANAIFLSAKSLVATPEPVALIGISPKSFGFFYVNAQEAQGTAFLNNLVSEDIAAGLAKELVPGSNMNDSWLCAMETLKRNFPEFGGRVSYVRYRRLQYHALLHSNMPRRFQTMLSHMKVWEIVVYGAAALLYFAARILPGTARSALRDALSHGLFSRSPRFDPRRTAVPYQDILQAARAHAR